METILITLAISFGIQAVLFVFAASLKTDKVTDLSYGLTFILIVLVATWWRTDYSLVVLLPAIMVIVWAVRLAGYLFLRILKMGRDKRFDGLRERPVEFAKFWSLQGLSIAIIILPTVIYLSNASSGRQLGALEVIGFAVWLAGLIIETVADWQKFQFKSDSKNAGRWLATGLWKYSRHPNYLGEIMCWWGLFIYVLPALTAIELLSVIGPIFITILLLFVTGIPPLEKRYNQRYSDNPEYQKYKKSTPLLLPSLR